MIRLAERTKDDLLYPSLLPFAGIEPFCHRLDGNLSSIADRVPVHARRDGWEGHGLDVGEAAGFLEAAAVGRLQLGALLFDFDLGVCRAQGASIVVS